MKWTLPLFPEQASSMAGRVDALYFFLVAVTIFFSVLIAALEIYFAIKYRRRSEREFPEPIEGSMKLESIWIIIPFVLSMVMFVWGASVYFALYRPPRNALEIYVVAKQWMWKFQHLDGQREINELHVPVNQKVKLIMATEDVIHSFYVPAFRVKADVVPGRYTTAWFEGTKPGRYHLFCAEYCGTNHSAMGGWVDVMEPADYQAWMSGGSTEMSFAALGQKLFQDLACHTCHRSDATGRGPVLEGLFGKTVTLAGGGTVKADEAYVRESILNPRAKVVAGFEAIMPTFQGLVSEEQLLQLIAYIRSIGPSQGQAAATGAAADDGSPGSVPAESKSPQTNPSSTEPKSEKP
ncbi:MAG TPA: cytochrome c oxidase subunit II [Terriglobia bacterium]|nr:cytochrome c oxidase subunit II [Terriglobia bacterium]